MTKLRIACGHGRAHRLGARYALAIAVTALLAPVAHATAPPEKIALTGGHIIPVVGDDIESGTVLIERGIITAIGTDIEIPFDAMEVDCTGRVLMPGMINAHSSRGMDIANENLPVTPFLDVYDAIDPSQAYFEDALRDGVTTIHIMPGNNTVIGGVSRVVRPIGLTVDEMTVQPDIGLKLSTTPKGGFDRMRQMATFRETFSELDDYLLRLAEAKYEEKLKDAEEELTVGPAEARSRGESLIQDSDYDDKHANLVRLRRGDLRGWMYCGAATDVGPAVRLAEEQGFEEGMVFVLGGQSYRAVGELAATGRPAVVGPSLMFQDRDPRTGELEQTFIPGVLHDAGVTFALLPNPSNSMAERYLNYQAALCVRNGIPRQVALEAITLQPARMLGLGDRLGSLEVGKTGNVVVMSGDPLDFTTWVEHVYIDGVLAYDRERDPRLKRILELEERQNAEAETPVEVEVEEADADEAEGDDDGGAEDRS